MKENQGIKVKGQLRGYLTWPLWISLFVLFGNAAAFLVDVRAGGVMLPFTALYLAAAVWLWVYSRRRVLGGLVEFSAEYAWIQKQLLSNMELPYGLVDEDGRLVWTNQAFQEVLSQEKGGGKNLLSLFPEVTRTDLAVETETARVHTSYGGSRYQMDLQPLYVTGSEEEENEALIGPQKLIAVYLFDETEILHYRQQITIGQLAGMSHMSDGHFCRLFKKYTFKTPVQYINRVRLSAAMDLLLESDRKVLDIAFDTGFNSLSYFIGVFKQSMGCTPTEFRRQHGRPDTNWREAV